jgi:hypothetical protein
MFHKSRPLMELVKFTVVLRFKVSLQNPWKLDFKYFLFELFVFVHCGAEVESEKEGREQCGSEDGSPVDV